MANIRSNTPINLVVNGATVLSAANAGITLSGEINSPNSIPSASYALNAATASYALNAGEGGVSKGFVIAMAAAM